MYLREISTLVKALLHPKNLKPSFKVTAVNVNVWPLLLEDNKTMKTEYQKMKVFMNLLFAVNQPHFSQGF